MLRSILFEWRRLDHIKGNLIFTSGTFYRIFLQFALRTLFKTLIKYFFTINFTLRFYINYFVFNIKKCNDKFKISQKIFNDKIFNYSTLRSS